MRKHRVEIAAVGRPHQAARLHQREQQKQGEAAGQRQRDVGTGSPVQAAEGFRPGVFGVGVDPQVGERARQVDRELVRRRVLAGVQAGAAVVAQVGEVMHVVATEFEAPRHRREHRAKAFAVATGVADREFARGLGFGLRD